MEIDNKIIIKTLGNCSIACRDKIISDKDVSSKKFWTALGYLVINRYRPIPQSELVDILYPGDESNNPGNALKTLIHRIRRTLEALEYVDSRRLILNVRGAYKWSADLPCEIDLESFENLCNRAFYSLMPDEDKIEYLLAALDIYKGDFLPMLRLKTWTTPIILKYKSMFRKALDNAINLLEEKGDFETLVSICRHALKIDPYDERLYSCIIHSLVELGKNKEALKEYNLMSNLFYNQFGISPSNDLKKLYREIIKSVKIVETDLSIIQDDLTEAADISGAFFCEYEIFKDIYRLEVRASSRIGGSIHLGHLSLAAKPGSDPSIKSLNYYMDKLKECITFSLRRGDVFTRYSISQFIILLPSNTYESALSVMRRLSRKFHSEYPRAPFIVDSSVRAMELMTG
ncbi:MAG: SARP family transcriptional regulator [Clostridiales bacterium]|jgi:DNA-binding SARP family transcriptional activator|nr:SARP family transcriptional regulator [Clostridiales bacterium]